MSLRQTAKELRMLIQELGHSEVKRAQRLPYFEELDKLPNRTLLLRRQTIYEIGKTLRGHTPITDYSLYPFPAITISSTCEGCSRS